MKRHIISTLTVAVLATITALPALADPRHDGHRGRDGWHGERDIRHFHNNHFEVWRGGRWHHGRHDGRLGWWWVAAGMWYFYPQPVYPYPDPYIPPVVIVQPAPVVVPAPAPAPQPAAPAASPPAQNWYYCEASKSYYPYVSSCPAGWKTVPATPPGVPAK